MTNFKQTILLYKKMLIFSFFCLNISFYAAKASNITAAAADLSYTFLGFNTENKAQYEISLHLYYHCITNDNIANLGLASVAVTSATCANNSEIFLALQTTENATPLCLQNENNSNCDGGNINGMMRYTYSNASNPLVLECEATDWTLHFSEIYRNPEISNLQNPDEESLYIKAIINNSNGQNYNSPQFNYFKMPYFCKNITDTLKQHITNGNNANISYESVTILGGNQEDSFELAYADGFSAENPLTATDYNFNNNTGEIQFTPTETQNAVLAIWVEERDNNGNLIAATMRNIQIVVVECDNQPISIHALQSTYGIAPNENLNFEVQINDADINDSLSIFTNISTDFPSEANVNMTGTNNNLSLNFDWTPAEVDTGLYYLTIQAQDNHCPIMSYQVASFPILVTCDIITATDEFVFCQNANTEMEINVQGGSPFFWQPEPQNLSENGATAILSPTENTVYTITNSCGIEKNISIEVKDGFALSNFSDLRLCQNETATLEPIIAPANQNYTYAWTSNQTINCPNCPIIDILPTETTTYTLNVNDDFGCEITETINIEVENLPEINIVASSLKVLKGQNVVLEVVGNDFETVSWNDGSNNISFSATINETTTFTAIASNANGCTTTKSITIEAICEAPPIPSAFSPNNDGINDIFAISYFNFENFEMKIYDRWGNTIFETNDQNEGWNGENKNRICDIGTYIYVIRAKINCESTTFPNGELSLKGNITLIR